MMGSGNTKRKKKLEQDEQTEVNPKATKGKPHKNEEEIDQYSIKNSNPNKQEEAKTKTTKEGPLKTEKTKSPTSRQSAELIDDTTSSPKETEENENQLTVLEEKPVSKTLEITKMNLSARGYTDESLIEYSDKAPHLKDTFILMYDSLKQLKSALKKEGYYSNCRPIRNISDSYSRQKESASKIALDEFLADIGFADVVKDAFLKLQADFPNILSYDRETGRKLNLDETTGVMKMSDDSDSREVKKAQDFLSTVAIAAINYTDLCDAMNLAFNEAGLVPILVAAVDKLKDCTKHHLMFLEADGTLVQKTERGTILSRILGTLHNLSKRVPTRANFQACNAVKVVLPMIEDKVPLYATKALLLLAYLIDEENNNLIMANKGIETICMGPDNTGPIKYLVSLIDKANQSSKRRYMGFSNSELAEGLAQIAINDANKKQIVANGAIPVLARMIRGAKSEEEEIAAAEALWVLAFDNENKEKMQSDKTCMEMLYKLRESRNDRVKKAASGALWEIEGKKQHSSHLEEKKQHSSHSTDTAAVQGSKPSAATGADTGAAKGAATTNHVMISYQWDVQKTLIRVKDRLQAAGYRVWMDLEQMGGSTLEAMAKAVENSTVVLVCVSQKYKESSNCRSEAEYAFQLHKDIIPLMMDHNYRPDGWLGMIMGSKLWIDFSQRHARLDSSMKDLQKELGDRGKGDPEIVQVSSVDVVDAKPTIDVSGWTNDDVMNWMKGFGLVIKKKNPRVSDKMNGPLLTRLHSLRNESPEFYYSSLKDDVGLSDVFDVMLFTDELEKLVG